MAFESPNYTQVPNDLFEMMPSMTEAELRVALVLCRQTFGYHRDQTEMSLREMSEATGLSVNGAVAGAKAAEERGLVQKISDGQKTTAWKLIVVTTKKTTKKAKGVSASDTGCITQCYTSVSPSDTQLGLNKKETIKETEAAAVSDGEKQRPNIYTVYEQEIGPLTSSIGEALRDAVEQYTEAWVVDALKVSAASGVHNWRYAHGILKSWKAKGRQDVKAKPAQPILTVTAEGGMYV